MRAPDPSTAATAASHHAENRPGRPIDRPITTHPLQPRRRDVGPPQANVEERRPVLGPWRSGYSARRPVMSGSENWRTGMRRSRLRIGTRGAGRRFAVDRQGQAGARTGARPPVHGGGDHGGALPRAAWPRTRSAGAGRKAPRAALGGDARIRRSRDGLLSRILDPDSAGTGSCLPAAESAYR